MPTAKNIKASLNGNKLTITANLSKLPAKEPKPGAKPTKNNLYASSGGAQVIKDDLNVDLNIGFPKAMPDPDFTKVKPGTTRLDGATVTIKGNILTITVDDVSAEGTPTASGNEMIASSRGWKTGLFDGTLRSMGLGFNLYRKNGKFASSLLEDEE